MQRVRQDSSPDAPSVIVLIILCEAQDLADRYLFCMPIYKVSRRAAAKIPPPGGALSPPVSPGLLPAQWRLYRTSALSYRTSRTSRTSRTALSIDLQLPPSCPSQLPLPALLHSTSSSSPILSPILAPWRPPCRSRRKRSRRPTGPIGPTRLIRQRARPIG